MPAKLEAKEHNLSKVFNDDYLFEIPVYQRPYAWTTEQVEVLLDDLTDAMDRDNATPYFLGSVVIIKRDGDAKSQVVDGQQRLTTLTMLLCVLRDMSDDKQLDEFVRQAGNKYKGVDDRFRVGLRERDREFFRQNVQEMGSVSNCLQLDPKKFSDSQKQILENVKYLNEKLREHNEQRREKLAGYIIQNCYLVVVSASDGESAHRIFSVMNDRGLNLSPTDILKAEVLDKIPRCSQDTYADKWENVEEEHGRDRFRDLFTHIRMIYRKDKQRETLQAEFRSSVLSPMRSQDFIDDVLEPYSRVYGIVSDASYESTGDADKVNALLRYLHRLDNFEWMPPAMAYLHRNELKRGTFLKFIQGLERLAYGLFILRENINRRTNRYARVIRAIDCDDDLFAEESPLQLSSDEKLGILRRLDGDIYGQTRVRLPLLMRLDSLLSDAGVTYQYPVITIEHVLPQRPASDSMWVEWFPDDAQRDTWTNRLANLALLSRRKNTKASNYEFERKKREYFQQNSVARFALTTQVVGETEWTPAVLARRQCFLVHALKQEWRLS